jgi:uncharacterized UBP type Zn finger protein
VRVSYKRDPVELFLSCTTDPVTDFQTQMGKLAYGLLSTKYIDGTSEISPRMLKTIVGQNHAEFSSTRQQDVQDYYAHFLKFLSRYDGNTRSIHTHTHSLSLSLTTLMLLCVAMLKPLVPMI